MAGGMRIKLVGMLVGLLTMAASASASAAPGDLDPTFGGGDGTVTTDFGGTDPARAVAVQSDGKIVVAGGNGDFALARYNQDGSLDTGFGGDGTVTTDFGGTDSAKAVVVQPNGKIVVAGTSSSSFALARYNQDGSLDTGFGGGDGLVTTAFPGSEGDEANALVLQPNGKIVAAGTSSSSFALARYNQDGSLDTGFGGGDGLVTTAFPGSEGDEGNALVLQPNGKLVAVGTTHIPPHGRGSFALARYNADGALDTGFGGGDGLATGVDNNQATSADLAPNGQIVVAGGWESFRVARFNSNGSVDTGFDGTGALFPDYKGTARLAYAVQVQKDGQVVAAGYVNDDAASETDFAVARFDTDGSLDASFGGDGMVTTDFSGGSDYARDIALQPDGKVVVAGRTESSGSDFAVARYEGNAQSSSAAVGPVPPPSPGGSPDNPAQAQAPHKARPSANRARRKCRALKSKRARRKCARRHARRSSAA
jgi:serralysin